MGLPTKYKLCSPRPSKNLWLCIVWEMICQWDHIASNLGCHSKVKFYTEENIRKIHSFLMKALNTQRFASSLLCPAYCPCNEPLSLGRVEMPHCLSAREISGFWSLDLRNYLTIMDNNGTKLPGRFENKHFSEWG